LIGRLGLGLTMDLDAGRAVWNQPIRGYQSTLTPLKSARDANRLLDVRGRKYTIDPAAQRFYDVTTTIYYIDEQDWASTAPSLTHINDFTKQKTVRYLLELDDGDNVIGGEWVGDSVQEHPDTLWVPNGYPGPASDPVIDLAKVKMLLELSLKPEPPSSE